MIAAALTAAVAFGAADWLGGAATTRAGSVRRVLLISEPVAALVLLAALVAAPGRLSTGAVVVGVAAGLAAGVGQACLYTALATGPAAVAAPICGIVSIAVPVTYTAATGDPLDPRQWAGTALVTVAVIVLGGLSRRTDPSLARAVAAARGALARTARPPGRAGGGGGPHPAPALAGVSNGAPLAGAAPAVVQRPPPAPWPPAALAAGPPTPRPAAGQYRDAALAAVAGAGFAAYTIVLGHAPAGSSLWPVVLAHAALAVAVLGLLLATAFRRPAARSRLTRPGGAGAPLGGAPAGQASAGARAGVVHGEGWAPGWSAALGLGEAIAAAAILLAARADIAVAAVVVAAHPAVTVLLARHLDGQRLGSTRALGLMLTCTGLLLLTG